MITGAGEYFPAMPRKESRCYAFWNVVHSDMCYVPARTGKGSNINQLYLVKMI